MMSPDKRKIKILAKISEANFSCKAVNNQVEYNFLLPTKCFLLS